MPIGNKNYLRAAVLFLVFTAAGTAGAQVSQEQSRTDNWESIRYRRWLGENLWANRLADWEVSRGWLMPTVGDPDLPVRTVHAITRQVHPGPGYYTLSVRVSSENGRSGACRVGFLVGAGAGLLDYRAAALVHCSSGKGGGLLAFLETGKDCRLSFRDNSTELTAREYPELAGTEVNCPGLLEKAGEIILTLEVGPSTGEDQYDLHLSLSDPRSGENYARLSLENRPEREVLGSVALAYSALEPVSHPSLRLRDFRVWGDKVSDRPERAFGPITGILYSLADSVLKLTAQFAPVAYQGEPGGRFPLPLKAWLELRQPDRGNAGWATADSARITTPDYTARFRVESLPGGSSLPFRVVYHGQDGKTYSYQGTVAGEPKDAENFRLAAFTGMGVMGRTADSGPAPADAPSIVGRWTPANLWFPFEQTVDNLAENPVDLLCFTGDQVYEGKPTAPEYSERFPVWDYLYKWYIWHWAFGPLTRRRPAVCQVDDHDVYQGNIWGWGGRLNMAGHNNYGGYMMDPLFVRLVERTQCSHNPDPYDPSPILNGIGVYYTGFSYGGVSFAVVEDRKFKSQRFHQGPGAALLGRRQLSFLEDWATDWHGGASVKVVLSQGTYASAQTDREGKITRDFDTDGWPKEGRDRALSAFRKARALVVCGDQHLSTLIKMGLEAPADGPVQFCVPALGNIFWRWFYAAQPGGGPLADPEGYTGDFLDGFGNHFRLLAAANPTDVQFMGDRDQTLRRWNSRPGINEDLVRLCQGDGVGIVRIDKQARSYRIECWPYDVKPGSDDRLQFKGWPASFTQAQMDGRPVELFLARVNFSGTGRVCAAVFHGREGLVYSCPLKAPGEILPAYREGEHQLLLFDPENPQRRREFRALNAVKDRKKAVNLEF
ncbi:MAG: hypothetical protein JXQ83_12875 [Candidatus Glassbacteria bacterium]|nr:hypothetical protein [Candidatus Glassbacteria bacterium]